MKYQVAEIRFGGEIGTRPAMILNENENSLTVLKMTTRARGNETYSKYRLSGFSGVKGYVVTNNVYTVPKSNVKRYTGRLFDFEGEESVKRMNFYKRKGLTNYIKIGG